MWSSKDIALIIFMAVLGLVSTVLVVQMAHLITGIAGANYVFTIILAIQTSFALLIYEGRRWRFLVQITLFTILITPTYLGGPPFSMKTSFVVTAFVADLVVNSFYKTFKNQGKLKWWSVIAAILFWTVKPFTGVLERLFFYTAETATMLINVVLLLLPVIIVESIAGGYLGYRIYKRVMRNEFNKDNDFVEFSGSEPLTQIMLK